MSFVLNYFEEASRENFRGETSSNMLDATSKNATFLKMNPIKPYYLLMMTILGEKQEQKHQENDKKNVLM